MDKATRHSIRLETWARGAGLADSQARRLDQYYTLPEVAEQLYSVLPRFIDFRSFLLVEPSAGAGAFYRLFPPGSIGIDLDPKCPGVVAADFLKLRLPPGRPIAVIGNPPFGINGAMAVRFVNHAAAQAEFVAMILPASFGRSSIVNRLAPTLHLVHSQPVEPFAFLFEGKPFDVAAVFQIWRRQAHKRDRMTGNTTDPDFAFVARPSDDADKASRPNFCLQRIGAQAGRIHHDFSRSESSTYFIKGDARVEAIMHRLELQAAAREDVVSVPSLAKTQVVGRFRAHVARYGW